MIWIETEIYGPPGRSGWYFVCDGMGEHVDLLYFQDGWHKSEDCHDDGFAGFAGSKEFWMPVSFPKAIIKKRNA